ncbi:MAG: DUF1186 family protein [Rhabdochlamydiaceae bacterium]|nr:DUF1186 family protein [Rhabdochlamydiaceae bacterium]
MKTDSTHALQLIEKILTKEIEFLSKEEADFLLDHRDVCTRKLLPILALEITQIKADENWSFNTLSGCLKLLAGFEENRAFDWVIQLHDFPEVLEDENSCFILRYWADLLIATISSEWYKLKQFIEDSEVDSEIREACLEALVLLVVRERLDRSVVVEYFNSLYSKILSGELEDPELVMLLLESSLCIWPGDSMEEIRELFGFDLVDEDFVDLLDVLNAYDEGKEECLEDVNSWVTSSHLYDFFKRDEEIEEDSLEYDLEESEYLDDEEIEHLKEVEKDVRILFPNFEIKGLSAEEQKKHQSLPQLLLEDPEQALEIAGELLTAHFDIPILLYSFYLILTILEDKVAAMQVLKKWIEKFPNDLLGKIEYAHYFLRRGEPEKAEALFSSTWSLAALYPERESFHEIECLKFFHLIGCYFLQIGEIEKAQEQAQILDATNPRSFECYHLQKKIALRLREDSFIEDL